MKQIVATKGQVKCIYRFNGKDIYLKANNMQYSQQLIDQIKAKGGKVIQKKDWLFCDIFGEHTEAKLGGVIIDLTVATNEAIEEALVNFFLATLESSEFKTEVSTI